MKKQILRVILAGTFLLAITVNYTIEEGSTSYDISLAMKNIEALADGEGSGDCTRTCFDDKCEAVWEDMHCNVTCGSTSCDFTYAKKKS